jgi:hypothetical protein
MNTNFTNLKGNLMMVGFFQTQIRKFVQIRYTYIIFRDPEQQ